MSYGKLCESKIKFKGQWIGCRAYDDGHTTGHSCGGIEAQTENGEKIICTITWSKPLPK